MQKTPQLPADPNLQAQQQASQQANITALQQQTQGDTASLMARYGTRLALANIGGSPTTSPLMPSAHGFFGGQR